MNSTAYINRELSWIDFNQRVLQEALKKELPLLERLKFLAIVNSNFDEFLMVRMANLIHEMEWGDRVSCPSGLHPSEILDQALEKIHRVQKMQNCCLIDELRPLLEDQGLKLWTEIPPNLDSSTLEEIFQSQIAPLLIPLGWGDSGLDLDLIKNGQIYLFLQYKKQDQLLERVVPVPPNLNRFVYLAEGGDLIPQELLIFSQLSQLFPGEEWVDGGFFRILRDADLSVNEKRDENFLRAMEEVLEDRARSKPLFLEYSHCSVALLKTIQKNLQIPKDRSFEQQGILRLKDLFEVLNRKELKKLQFPSQPPVKANLFWEEQDVWQELRDRDHMLHHPYQSFSPVVQLLQRAARDPKVLAIKMTLYRTSGDSPIIRSLQEAARKGKQVMVMVELKARFDEGRNIQWAKKLSRAGVMVVHGVAGLKVHSKAMLILRKEQDGIRRYLHLGTGNYNDRTAELYTDISYFTCREEICSEASRFFNCLSGYSDPPELRKMAMAPFSLRNRLNILIEREISRAEAGEKAGIQAKLNSLNDPEMIEMLYRASQAGVEIKLNVRGICSLVPGIPGQSENIQVFSLIGRYLEHARIVYFQNGGQDELYLSSADWMPRNLDRRVELLFPVEDSSIKKKLLGSMELTLKDNCQTHKMNSNGVWMPSNPDETQQINSQNEQYQIYLEQQNQEKKKRQEEFKVRKGLS